MFSSVPKVSAPPNASMRHGAWPATASHPPPGSVEVASDRQVPAVRGSNFTALMAYPTGCMPAPAAVPVLTGVRGNVEAIPCRPTGVAKLPPDTG